jgi:putative ubiquitin-RnfH superfamily antitoxin RatB of RatAB toxin-antitoxin module
MNTPYVYFLKNKTTGLKYIGVRYSKNCHFTDFWKKYFTSSKLVKDLIYIYGTEDFEFKILKVFINAFDAIKYENSLLVLATKRKDYLNISLGFLTNEKEFIINQEKMKIIRSLTGKLTFAKKLGFHKYTKEEKLEISKKGGLQSAINNLEKKTGIWSKESQIKTHKTLKEKQLSAYYDPLLKEKICLKGGLNGIFSKNYYEKNNLTEEDRINKQRERGKKGGPKNKGFFWYTDGIKSLKYTKKQQEIKSFDVFLSENTNFKKGRIIK